MVKKKSNNYGFSMVELIIVMAIMAVLMGVLTPVYLRYVERTKRTTDCTGIGSVLDACEVLAADPDVTWAGQIVIVIDTNQTGHETSYTGGGPIVALSEMVPEDETFLTADWGPFTITATRGSDGKVTFDIADSQIAELANYSTVLSNRLE